MYVICSSIIGLISLSDWWFHSCSEFIRGSQRRMTWVAELASNNKIHSICNKDKFLIPPLHQPPVRPDKSLGKDVCSFALVGRARLFVRGAKRDSVSNVSLVRPAIFRSSDCVCSCNFWGLPLSNCSANRRRLRPPTTYRDVPIKCSN